MIRLQQVLKQRGQGAQRYSLAIERLQLQAGARVALVGPSGCGKSTLLDLLALVLAPDSAETFTLELAGTTCDIAELWRQGRQSQLAQLRSRHLGYVLQAGGLLGFLDARNNIALPRQLLGMPDNGQVQRLAQALDVQDQLGKYPAQLSIGQRQRVSCARALAHGPTLLLADEPTAALDPLNAERVMQLLLAQAAETGATCVVATHDEALAQRAGMHILRMGCRRDADGGVSAHLEQAA
ncbi:ABC transporter ATP-binding protein [Ectopseudomonas mendocina]|uniref:ABC transporter ATP-binding protein n=1 Tax=Ectopseudomonas mendocina TaxID=300 RepID=UPI001179B681|nr:ABC transporter ATP-binding protein [Pseudomonas sp. ALS1131]TRO42188.1 ABC transporter ATP-binding protein [Pseudomonas sp. ALS1131]